MTAIAEEGTLFVAAEKLHVSRPALTRAVQRLEQDTGLTLFERAKNRATLNEAGVYAVECAKSRAGCRGGECLGGKVSLRSK